MLTIKIIIWICKSELGAMWASLAVFLWKQFPWHLRSTFGIPACLIHTLKSSFSKHSFHLGYAFFFFHPSIELDIAGMLRYLAGHCANPDPAESECRQNGSTVSTGPLIAGPFWCNENKSKSCSSGLVSAISQSWSPMNYNGKWHLQEYTFRSFRAPVSFLCSLAASPISKEQPLTEVAAPEFQVQPMHSSPGTE